MERENKIYASSIRGYCSVETCWQFIYDISSQMEILHAQGKSFGEIDLKYIEVNGVQFRHVGEPCACCDVYGDTWKLAAAAYELLLGIPVLNGLGERSQTAQTPLPSLSGSDAEPLNRLLHGCMNYKKTERPKAGDIKSIACEELKTFAKPSRKPRVYSNENNTVQPGKYDKSWPESMIALLVSLLLLVTGSVQAQDYINARDEENTMKLLNAALLLRNSDEKHWNEAQNELAKRLGIFTMMDELKDYAHDCALIDKNVKSFGVNRMIKELKAGKRVQNTGKGLLDGSDSRFNYSMYEKGIKKGCTSSYLLSGRSGRQVFVIVPYTSGQEYTTVLKIEGGEEYTPYYNAADGVTYYCIDTDKGPAAGEKLKFEISNTGNGNASFVIINHNYRNR